MLKCIKTCTLELKIHGYVYVCLNMCVSLCVCVLQVGVFKSLGTVILDGFDKVGLSFVMILSEMPKWQF